MNSAIANVTPPGAAQDLALAAVFTQLLGVDGVKMDTPSRRFYSQDIWSVAAETVEMVLSPASC